MNIEKPTLAEKQAFWAEQLPLFKETYWLPEHFELLKFDMEAGNFIVRDDIDPAFEDDADDLYHRINTGWSMWKRAVNHMQKKLEGCAVVPVEPTEAQWGGLARVLGRYMQNKDRYCPKTLKRHLDMFADEIPEWLNKEVPNWESEHAFATADLPVFIYKAMVEAARGGNHE